MSTATPPPAGTPPKRPSQSGNLFLLLLVLTGLILLWVGADLWTPELAGVRVVRRDADSMIRRDAGLVRAKLAREPFDGDLDHWSQSRLPIADEVADAQNRREAVLARATRRIPVIPRTAVRGDQNSWVTMAPVGEPLHVTVPPTDTIKPSDSSSYESNANGIFPEGLPSRYDSNMTVIAEDRKNHGMQLTRPGNLYELVGRVCEQGGCNPAMPMGTDSVVCPGGYLQAWYNGRVVVDGEATTMRFNRGVGQYRLTIVPDEFAEKTCAAHPGKSIIQTKGGEN